MKLIWYFFQKRRPKSRGKKKASKSPKVSLAKLSNKKLNKLAKQGKLKKPKNKLEQVLKDRTQPEYQRNPSDEEDISEEDDIPLNEADYEYFATPDRNFDFLTGIVDEWVGSSFF